MDMDTGFRKSAITPKDMAEHVAGLCAAYRIRIHYTAHGEDGAANPDTRDIRIAPVTDETQYAIALHEIGHVCAPNGNPGMDRVHDPLASILGLPRSREVMTLIMVAERAAWEWAEHYARVWTPEMDAIRDRALEHYRREYDASMPRPDRPSSRQEPPPPPPTFKPFKPVPVRDFARSVNLKWEF